MGKANSKVKLQLGGVTHKVPKEVARLLDIMSELIKSHEIALISWYHRIFVKGKRKKQKFEEELGKYVELNIPHYKDVLKRMNEIDEKIKKEKASKQEVKEK